MLGPLLNPAGAVYGLIGVYSPDISMLMAQALQQLGTRKALVVHSQVSIPQQCFDLICFITHFAHTTSAGGCMALHALLHCHQAEQDARPQCLTASMFPPTSACAPVYVSVQACA